MPIPEAEDFPFVSSIYNKDLKKKLKEIDFSGFSEEAKNEMSTWFHKTELEGRDLIIFIY